jgi:SNF2 family DNA or RNA helicase
VASEINHSLQLRSYQQVGAGFLAKRSSALLADEMGLGKTAQAICAVRLLHANKSIFRVLVVCPSSLRLNWRAEFSKWSPETFVLLPAGTTANRRAQYSLPVPVTVSSYDHIRRDSDSMDNDSGYDLVILDEAQVIKNLGSETSLACRSLQRQRAWALTGTPVENSPDDLAAIFAFVNRGLLSPGMSTSDIHALMRPYYLRRTKDDVQLQLPPMIDQDVIVSLTSAQRASYAREMWKYSDGNGTMANATNILAAITHLKQICNFDPDSGASSKMEVVSAAIESLSTRPRKILIFSQYVETLKWIATQLPVGIPSCIYSGALNEVARDAIVSRFQDSTEDMVLLMSLKAGGVGLNLTASDMVILFDRWWNPATEKQAIARAQRYGRRGPLHLLRFVVRDSVEERIAEILDRKASAFEAIIGNAVNANEMGLTREELEWILTGHGKRP